MVRDVIVISQVAIYRYIISLCKLEFMSENAKQKNPLFVQQEHCNEHQRTQERILDDTVIMHFTKYTFSFTFNSHIL